MFYINLECLICLFYGLSLWWCVESLVYFFAYIKRSFERKGEITKCSILLLKMYLKIYFVADSIL